eukprot:TRINITY_DN11689_c0_g1_i1.p1 TRINITY_DN11689_c0_g1~~TRINITY_DN11689_c0_g1_i1.p1  ORF type:complete len:202 (+),score=39.33 TRINITY_DN11689_c0_g1_i1:26-631(+)
MIVVLSDVHKQDLAFLKDVDAEYLQEFCKLAFNYMNSGSDGNRKIFVSAGKKLGIKPTVVESGINALCFLYTEATKLQLREQDFNDSIVVLGFSEEHNAVLKETYVNNKAELRTNLARHEVDLPHFEALNWRLDVELASRTSRKKLNPVFIFQIETTDSNGVKQIKTLQADFANLKHLTSEMESALDTVKQVYARRVARNV